MPENMRAGGKNKPDIEPVEQGQAQIIPHVRDIHTYPITEQEINDLCSQYMSPDFGFFSLSIGILIALVVALLTTQMSDRVFATFVAVAIVAFVGVIFFGFRTLKELKRVKKRADEIRGKSE